MRSVVGGLLVTVAAVGTFVAWDQAARGASSSYVVARRGLHPGQQLTADDVELAPLDLSGPLADRAFDTPGAVVGRVALGPVGEGELLQAAQLSEDAGQGSLAEVSFALPRDRAVGGRIRSGDWVDVFVTEGDSTRAVLERARVVAVGDGGGSLSAAGTLTVTVGLDDPGSRGDLVHAVRAGEVTLVRSTHAGGGAVRADDG